MIKATTPSPTLTQFPTPHPTKKHYLIALSNNNHHYSFGYRWGGGLGFIEIKGQLDKREQFLTLYMVMKCLLYK